MKELRLNTSKKNKFRIIAFTHSGSYASQYSIWADYLPDEIECIIYERPGSGIRVAEALISSWQNLIIDAMATINKYLNLPYLIFGHSLGGSIAFEVAKAIAHKKYKLPLVLAIGDREAPNFYPDKIRCNLSDQQFCQMLVEDYGMKEELIAHPEIVEFFLPILKNDFNLADSYCDYVKVNQSPITSDIVVFRPRQTHDSLESHQAWANYTTQNLEIINIKGGHFFVFEQVAEFMPQLVKQLMSRIK